MQPTRCEPSYGGMLTSKFGKTLDLVRVFKRSTRFEGLTNQVLVDSYGNRASGSSQAFFDNPDLKDKVWEPLYAGDVDLRAFCRFLGHNRRFPRQCGTGVRKSPKEETSLNNYYTSKSVEY